MQVIFEFVILYKFQKLKTFEPYSRNLTVRKRKFMLGGYHVDQLFFFFFSLLNRIFWKNIEKMASKRCYAIDTLADVERKVEK